MIATALEVPLNTNQPFIQLLSLLAGVLRIVAGKMGKEKAKREKVKG